MLRALCHRAARQKIRIKVELKNVHKICDTKDKNDDISRYFYERKRIEVHYIGGAEVLPPPLAGEDEAVCIEMLTSDESGQLARKQLIEHNLRLVVYIDKKI